MEYTVFGVRDDDGRAVVAAVVKGEQTPVDCDPCDGEWQRWAVPVTAGDPGEAEEVALGEMAEDE